MTVTAALETLRALRARDGWLPTVLLLLMLAVAVANVAKHTIIIAVCILLIACEVAELLAGLARTKGNGLLATAESRT